MLADRTANKFALLIDGASYYGVLGAAMQRSKHTISLLGWDLDSRMRFFGNRADTHYPTLRDFFRELVVRNPELHIHILVWSSPLLIARGRDPNLVFGRDPFNHPRIHLAFDSEHPPGASHHQKIVTIDDSLAFCGGMDLANGRWDTPEHLARDSRRVAATVSTRPRMMCRQWWIARLLQRWPKSYAMDGTGRPAGVYRGLRDQNAWPATLKPDLENVALGISRTDVSEARAAAPRQPERLNLDMIPPRESSSTSRINISPALQSRMP